MNSKLKEKRIAAGFTQVELAKASGVGVKSLALYEQNPEKINKASVGSIVRMADCLGCTVEDIIERKTMG